jgi:hypothetical protein
MRDVDASCSTFAVGFFTSMYGNVRALHCSPSSSESHCVWLRAFSADFSTLTRPRYAFRPRPAEIPFETIVLRVLRPMWIILLPVSACWRWLVSATEWNSPTELSPRRMQLGYFQVIAEPVSTCVHEMREFAPRQSPRLVTKL